MGLAANARTRSASVFRLPLEPDEMAVANERRADVLARSKRRQWRPQSLNFSEWDKPQDGAGDVADVISSGSMPPWFYVIMHPKANLSKTDQTALMNGLAATFRKSPPIGGG